MGQTDGRSPAHRPDLIRRHARLIQKIAYAYCRNATDREDIVQEVAVQLWRSHHNVGTKLGRIKDRLRVAFAQRALKTNGRITCSWMT